MLYRWTRLSEGSKRAGRSGIATRAHICTRRPLAHGHTYTLRATAATDAKSAAGVVPTTHNRDGYHDVERRRRRRCNARHQTHEARVPLSTGSSFTPARSALARTNGTISKLHADESVPLFKGRYVGLMSYPHGPTNHESPGPSAICDQSCSGTYNVSENPPLFASARYTWHVSPPDFFRNIIY